MLLVLNESTVSRRIERAACDDELVVRDGLAARRASCPGFRVCRRLVVRRRMIAEAEAVSVDVLRGNRAGRRIDNVFEVADDLLLGSDRQIGVRRALREVDARAVVQRREETRVVCARRERMIAAGHDFDARPIETARRTAVEREELIGLSNCPHAAEVELHLAKVLDVARRQSIRIDIEQVVRKDIVRRAARRAAIEEDVLQGGRRQRAITLAKIDGVARRLARAVRVAAVDFVAAAERAALDVDRIARSVARRHIVRRRECGIRRNVSAIELTTRIEHAALDVDGIVLRIGVLRGVDSRWIIFIRRVKKQIPALGIACIACRYRSAVKEIERIEIRAAIQCLRIACTHRGERKRRRTILFEVQRIVVRRIAIDRDTRMDVGAAARRRRFRGILETVAVED